MAISGKNYNISVIFSAVDKVSNVVKKIGNSTTQSLSGLQKTQKIINNLGDIGKNLTYGLTLPLVGLGTAATKLGMEYDDAMTRVQALTSATENEMSKLGETFKDMSGKFGYSMNEMSKAAIKLSQANYNVSDIIRMMPYLVNAAKTEMLDLSKVTEITTDVMSAFGLPISELGNVVDIIAITANKSKAGFTDIAEAFKPVAGFAKAAGIPLQEVAAQLGVLANAGHRGSIAGTELRNAFIRTIVPNQKLIDLTHKYKIALDDFIDEGGNITNFNGLIDELAKKGVTAGEIFSGWQERGGKAMSILQNSVKSITKGTNLTADAFKELFKELVNNGEYVSAIAMKINKSYGSIWKNLKDAGTEALISLSEALEPIIKPLLEGLTRFLNGFSKLSPEVKSMAASFLLIGAALGPIIWFATTLFSIGVKTKAAFKWLFAPGKSLGDLAIGGAKGISNLQKVFGILKKVFIYVALFKEVYRLMRNIGLIDLFKSLSVGGVEVLSSALEFLKEYPYVIDLIEIAVLAALGPIGQLVAAIKIINDLWDLVNSKEMKSALEVTSKGGVGYIPSTFGPSMNLAENRQRERGLAEERALARKQTPYPNIVKIQLDEGLRADLQKNVFGVGNFDLGRTNFVEILP